jgi:thioredoxin-related protein
MKKTLMVMVSALALVSASAGEWQTDAAKAQAQAKKENKLVLLDFTGSDWCGWCIKFKKDVLDTPEFKAYADKNLVLVEVDFPRKTKLSAEQAKANNELKKKYKVSGFPTFVILDGDGTEVGRQVGYAKGGPEAFTKKLDGFKGKKS